MAATRRPETIEYEIDVLDEEYLRHGDIGPFWRVCFKPRGQGPFPRCRRTTRWRVVPRQSPSGHFESTSNWHAAASWWPALDFPAFRRRPLYPRLVDGTSIMAIRLGSRPRLQD